jgi:hypothetical protein
MLHDAIVKTETVTSTSTEQITSEKTTTSTVVSSTTRFSTLTQTAVSTVTISSVYADPANVTLLFINMDGNFTYDIQAGPSSTSGAVARNSPSSLQLTGLIHGQTITITASTTGGGGCRTGEQFTMQLWIDGQIVAQSDSFCGDGTSGARIIYTV